MNRILLLLVPSTRARIVLRRLALIGLGLLGLGVTADAREAKAPLVFVSSGATGYVLTLPSREEGVRFPVIVDLPGLHMSAQLDRANWGFASQKFGFALLNLELDYDTMITRKEDLEALRVRISTTVQALVDAGQPLDPKRVFLTGTSRGGMTAINLALRYPGDFRAIGVACGSSLIYGSEHFIAAAKGQKFFLLHGEKDAIVPLAEFEKTKQALIDNGADVTAEVLPGVPHILPKDAYRKIVQWLAGLANTEPKDNPGRAP